jgi:PAS domain S-box-containing protein
MDKNILGNLILENLRDPILITDDTGNFLFIPPAIGQIFGYQPDEVIKMSNICHLTDTLLVDSKQLDSKKRVVDIEITIQGKADRIFILLATVKRINFEGAKARIYTFRDITAFRIHEENLQTINAGIERTIEQLTGELQKKSIALTEVLSHLEIEKQNIASRVDVNAQKLLLPIIDKLIEKASSVDTRYLLLIKQNLLALTSSIGIKLTSVKYRFTPQEINLCTLIKGGFSIKEIATMQNLSERTVETHRFNIRKKLGISSSNINLATYLSQL